MKIEKIDHVVFTVRDIEKTCNFYSRVFGMEVLNLENYRKALKFGDQILKLHEFGTKFDLNAQNPTCGSEDLCFITSIPLGKVVSHMHLCDVKIVCGPVRRAGAAGPIMSIYVRDSDGSIIEISNCVAD